MIKKFNFELWIYMPLILIIAAVFNINKIPLILAIGISMGIVCEILTSKTIKNRVIVLAPLVMLIIFQVINKKIEINKEYLIYYVAFYLTIVYVSRDNILEFIEKSICNNISRISRIYKIVFIIIIISSFISRGWMIIWGGEQFVSFFSYPHDAAYFLIGVECVFIIIYFNCKKKLLNGFIIIVLFVLSALTNSRAPFMLSLTITMYFVYIQSKHKVRIMIGAVYAFSILILVNLLFNVIDFAKIPIIEKFVRGYSEGNVTSSRDLIWNSILSGFETSPFKNKLTGNGLGYSFYVNKQNLNLDLWSHNDIYEILLGMGIIGVIVTIFLYYLLYKSSTSIAFTFIYLVVAYWNGLFVYYQATLLLPFFIVCIRCMKRVRKRELE